jgi:hypothetical protein
MLSLSSASGNLNCFNLKSICGSIPATIMELTGENSIQGGSVVKIEIEKVIFS